MAEATDDRKSGDDKRLHQVEGELATQKKEIQQQKSEILQQRTESQQQK